MGEPAVIVVTGANGLVGARVCAALADRGAVIRAVVRRAGSAPTGPEIHERVGDFADPAFAAEVLAGADGVVTTVHPMAGDLDTQRRIGVAGTTRFVAAAADAGVSTHVHISTAAVYDRSPGMGDVDESSPLVGDDGGPYAVTKRDLDAALADIDGITRVIVRPPAVLGPGETSVWNTLRPGAIRDYEHARHAIPDQTFSWVHVEDLAAFAADLSTSRVTGGPAAGACTAVNVAGGPATLRDYVGTVADAVGVAPIWDDDAAWTGHIRTDLARSWGWTPAVDLGRALRELAAGLRS
jgi:nucleoside-diphosphate-sugar epimerase